MYFITEWYTETGKKFATLNQERVRCHEAQIKLANSLGATSWRSARFCAFGGFSSLIFPEAQDSKLWKNVNDSENEWMPKLNSKAGKELRKQIDDLPKITFEDLNLCAGYDAEGSYFSKIGYGFADEIYVGFCVGEDWDYTPPSDCREVTRTEYYRIFTKPKP